MTWNALADRVLAGETPTYADAMAVLCSHDDELLDVLGAAFRVRSETFGRDVHIHVLRNARSGRCPEDCRFCSQSSAFNTGIEEYPIQDVETLLEGARQAKANGAARYCMVTATRGPSSRDLDVVCEAVERIKEELPGLQICTSLGLLTEEKAARLANVGVDRYNHNLETSERLFGDLVTTHTYADRVQTLEAAHGAGMETCCGGIVGMGEGVEDRVELAFSLKRLGVASIPVNFLNPRPGTPLGEQKQLKPADCLRTLAMFRFVHPNRDLRVASGREVCLRNMQALALYPANSIFSEGYLTTSGTDPTSDRALVEDAGFRVVELIES